MTSTECEIPGFPARVGVTFRGSHRGTFRGFGDGRRRADTAARAELGSKLSVQVTEEFSALAKESTKDGETECLLEKYYDQSLAEGNRVREKLREGVEVPYLDKYGDVSLVRILDVYTDGRSEPYAVKLSSGTGESLAASDFYEEWPEAAGDRADEPT